MSAARIVVFYTFPNRWLGWNMWTQYPSGCAPKTHSEALLLFSEWAKSHFLNSEGLHYVIAENSQEASL